MESKNPSLPDLGNLYVNFTKDVSLLHEQVCSDCFADHGLRVTATIYGEIAESQCPRCGSTTGRRLNSSVLGYVVQKFFVDGTRPGRHMPAVLIPGTSWPDDDIIFTPQLRRDYELLKQLTGFQLMRSAPDLIPMGITPLRLTLETCLGIHDWGDMAEPKSAAEAFAEVLDFPVEYTLAPTQLVFRVRLSPRTPSEPGEYDSPPVTSARANRLNRDGFRVFYGALDFETCVFEVKPSLEQIVHEDIYVATLRARRPLKLFDLLNFPFDLDGLNGPGSMYHFLRSLFFPADHDYRITQELGERIAARGYEGILYPSGFSYVRSASAYPNVALFGSPLASGAVILVSINRLCFRDIAYSCNLGPVVVE
ncbi:MAG: RES family NAD+ phosphorylase [Acidobacteriia bacterium]|nr:RES family NAD+ phosphorylase [Terriglobia bacterium]